MLFSFLAGSSKVCPPQSHTWVAGSSRTQTYKQVQVLSSSERFSDIPPFCEKKEALLQHRLNLLIFQFSKGRPTTEKSCWERIKDLIKRANIKITTILAWETLCPDNGHPGSFVGPSSPLSITPSVWEYCWELSFQILWKTKKSVFWQSHSLLLG